MIYFFIFLLWGSMNAMQQSEEQPIRVLSASVDPHLNHTRAQLLRHHGFDVTTSESSEHAREQLKSTPFDVLIFGTTLTRDMCWELAEAFRQNNWDGKIVEILPSPDAPIKNHPDAIVVSTDEPSQLIATIRDNVRNTTRSKDEESWRRLSSQAAVERDPDKLMKLVEEINRLLDERDERRRRPSSGDER